MRLRQSLVAALLTMTAAFPSWAATYYVAPKDAKISANADGSKGNPWADPLTALKKAKAGDTILLMDGDYGQLIVSKRSFTSPVTVRSLNGKKARLERISVEDGSRNIIFQNLSVWASDPMTSKANRIQTTGPSVTDIVFDSLDIRSGKDALSYPTWTKDKWKARFGMKGFQSKGTRITMKNSTITAMGFAVVLFGPETKFINNTVQGFKGDGMRVLGNNSVIRGNRITDCVRVDNNHMDGIQSWSQDGKPVDGLVIEDNTIIEWSNPVRTFKYCPLQGIGFFDGFYDNLVIRNNVIAITAYHGISVYGARKAQIVNNTVVNSKGVAAGYPWIAVNNHKNGTPSSDVVTSNNLAMKFTGVSNEKSKRTATANSVILYPAKVLQDVTKFNYRPKADSGFIDTGDAAYAPKTDIVNNKRPSGKAPDRGAYEANSTPAPSADPSATTDAAAPPASSNTAGKWLVAP